MEADRADGKKLQVKAKTPLAGRRNLMEATEIDHSVHLVTSRVMHFVESCSYLHFFSEALSFSKKMGLRG